MKNKQGPSIRNIPSQSFKVCHGCEFLDTQAMMRGHKSVTDNYTCLHPDFKYETVLFGSKRGRTIHFNHQGIAPRQVGAHFCSQKKRKKITVLVLILDFMNLVKRSFAVDVTEKNHLITLIPKQNEATNES